MRELTIDEKINFRYMFQEIQPWTEGDPVPAQYCHLCERKTDRQWILPIPSKCLMDVDLFGRKMLRAIFESDCYTLKIWAEHGAVEPDYEATIYFGGEKPNGVSYSSVGMWFETTEAI